MADKNITTTFKHALIYSASGILGKAIGFIMLPVYANYLRGEGYGIIGMIDVVISLMTLLIGYGIQGAMTRFYYEKKEESRRKEFISTAVILMFGLVLLVSFPVIIFNETIAFYTFGVDGLGHYIILAAITTEVLITAAHFSMAPSPIHSIDSIGLARLYLFPNRFSMISPHIVLPSSSSTARQNFLEGRRHD